MIENFKLSRLDPTCTIFPFDCGNKDLNDFLFNDALSHASELLAVTYILQHEGKTIAYFSVLNDSIRQGDTSKNRLKRVLGKISHVKRGYKSHPAVKVGRFAVTKEYQSHNIGSELMDYIKGYFLDRNKTGCRFIIVDADNNNRTIKFYLNNGFDFLTTEDKGEENRVMFFDLILFAPYVTQ